MIARQIKEKGILAKLLEKAIRVLLENECKKIGNLKIDIIASSIQIIRGIIQKLHIIAEEINYKDLVFDEIELEASEIKIILKIKRSEFKLKNNSIIKFKISLSENSLETILLSSKWNWIGDKIAEEILNHAKIDSLKIKKDQILIKVFKNNKINTTIESVDIKSVNGKIYLENKKHNKSTNIQTEDKVYIDNINIQNNLIIILGKSSVSF